VSRRAWIVGLAIAAGLCCVGLAETLTGTWNTDIILDLTAGVWPVGVNVDTEITVEYAIGDWTFASETDIEDGVWTNQDFDFAGVLGAYAISGDVEFEPDTPAFTELEVGADVSIAGVTLGAEFTLVPNGTQLILTAGVAADVIVNLKVTLGDTRGCDFDFEGLAIGIEFPFCCANIVSKLAFDCDGFDYVQFCFDGLIVENLPWLTLGMCVKFEQAQSYSKVVTFDTDIDLGVVGCDFDLYYRLDEEGGTNYDPLNVKGFLFDGLQIACEIGGVQFTGITYWGAGAPGILTGYPDFWEAYQIATTDDGCCGPFSFAVTVFFAEDPGATKLFDVAYFVASLNIQVATQFTFGMSLETDVQAGTVNQLTFSFDVEW